MNLTFCGSVNKNRTLEILPKLFSKPYINTNVKVMVAKREVGTHWEY